MKKHRILSAALSIVMLGSIFVTGTAPSAHAEETSAAPTEVISDEPSVIPNTLEQLVAKNTDFENNSVIYSDCYKFALEHSGDRDYLIVYNIPYEDTVGLGGAKWEEHLFINPDCYYITDCWLPGGPDRLIYTGCTFYSLVMRKPGVRFEKALNIMFCVIGEEPCVVVPDIDLSEYIYGVEPPVTETPPVTTAAVKNPPVEYSLRVSVIDADTREKINGVSVYLWRWITSTVEKPD